MRRRRLRPVRTLAIVCLLLGVAAVVVGCGDGRRIRRLDRVAPSSPAVERPEEGSAVERRPTPPAEAVPEDGGTNETPPATPPEAS